MGFFGNRKKKGNEEMLNDVSYIQEMKDAMKMAKPVPKKTE